MYQVEGFLGQGGMGAVYKGTQTRLQRKVAIKIMRRDQGRDHGFEERFRREALAMAQLNHPNIVSVIDYGEAGPDYLYIVMEFIDGTDLVGVIQSGQMTQEMALKLLPQICDALQFAHDNGIVHRDIKPANIMLTRDGRVKMADFGLAKRFDVESGFNTKTGTSMGTPDYAAPEQFFPSADVDHRVDIYALGVMIYQMITGTLPRGAWKPPSEKVNVDEHWDQIVSRALQTDPHDRYASVSEIKTDISGITPMPSAQGGMAGSPIREKTGGIGTPRVSTSTLTQAGGRRTTVAAASAPSRSKKPLLLGIGGLGLAAASIFTLWSGQNAKKPASANSGTSSAPATATKESPFVNTLGMKFVPIPGTRVLMCIHETRKMDFAAFAAANPVINSTSWQSPMLNELAVSDGLDHPVVNVSSYDAEGFCQWLEKTEGLIYRLPTDREWSVAVGVGDLEDQNERPRNLELNSLTRLIYPWGEAWPPPAGSANLGDNAAAAVMRLQGIANIAAYDDGFATTAPVMNFKPGSLGLYDMAGNVEEWVSDWWDDRQRMRVLRGTSFLDNWSGNSHSSKRRSSAPGAFYARCGFRCVIELNQPVAKPEPPAKPDKVKTQVGNAAAFPPTTTPPTTQVSSFPPGVWIKVDTLPKIELTPEGWFQTNPSMIYGTADVPGLKGLNHAIRARFRDNLPRGAKPMPTVQLIARSSLAGNYHVYVLRSMDAFFIRRDLPNHRGIMPPLASSDLPARQKPGDEFTLEFAAVGKTLMACCQGIWIKAQMEPDSTPAEGKPALFVSNTDLFRDVEVMNLDGLSEAEALRCLGNEAPGTPASSKTK